MSMRSILFLSIIITISSCVCALEIKPAYSGYVHLEKGYSLSSSSCEITKLKEGKNSDTYKVIFDSVNGGRNYYIGGYFKHHDSYEWERLILMRESERVDSFSVYDFVEVEPDTFDLYSLLK